MKVGWLADSPGYIGGAELTQAEFKAAAPDDVEVVDCPPGSVDSTCETFVVHNHWTYEDADLANLRGRVVRYYHDIRPMWVKSDISIFCSPQQRDRMRLKGECIPPPLNPEDFKPPRQSKKRREGTCSIAGWRSPGKGGQYVQEWAVSNDIDVHVYGGGSFVPQGLGIKNHGPVLPEKVREVLWSYERFVFLPWEFEPFCRTVAEAHFAGCHVVTNNLIGARHWLERPEVFKTATDDFWSVVCG